ncbi:MAG: hypothetical protein ABS62_04115 [Microbacterium sp. SCN 70-200]|uniref:hypothetical protein n=1 Tax=unclassified Microbacterium TaxID=2609290 RepID=UPI00086EDFD1|nr:MULTISPECIES: hypothetical protein [unclassified Microbacterium]MBN9213590.1 hypothetical protein [Microbacterium sp.]ODT42258.1 MAG: hypothetical protein ABS62_04115 [Microbacterium sp. SCN 70-200]OJV79113.1 MAG: hypothetical protein BGO46_02225 [Microbacterium sp. 70-16]
MVIDDGGAPAESTARDPAAELLVLVAGGDEGALARLYDLMGARVYGLLVDAVPGDAAEQLQLVFVEVWATAGWFDRAVQTGDAWVMGIARRRLVGQTSPSAAPLSRRSARELGAQPDTSRAVTPPLPVRARLLRRVSQTTRLDEPPEVPSAVATEPASPDAAAPVPSAPVATKLTAPVATSEPVAAAATEPAALPAPVPSAPPASVTPAEASPPTEVVQTLQRRNWTRGIAIGVVTSVLLIVLGWAAGALAALWQ